jgi:hypothetical protein
MRNDLLYRDVPAFRKRVFRLGLATNCGVEGQDLEWALEQGVNYISWTPAARRVTKSIKAVLKRDRESLEEMHWFREFDRIVHEASSRFSFRF